MAKTTIEFGDEATAALNRLAGVLNTSKADVLRNALSLYSYVHSQMGNGKALGIVDENSRAIDKVVVVPGLTFFAARTLQAGSASRL